MPDMPDFCTHAGRRAWAFIALVGGCIVFTVFAAVGVYLVSGNAQLSFYLALAAHAQVLVGLGSIGGLVVRRSVKITKDGAEYMDQDVRLKEAERED